MSTTRTITAFSTRGKNKAKIETDVTTWGELKPLLANEGFDLSTLAATESVKRTDLAHVDAVLPEGNFTVFLRPSKTKSGADYTNMSYRELKSLLTTSDKEALKEITGKNWTRCSTDDMRNYFINKGEETVTETTEEIAEQVEETVAPVTNMVRLSQINTLISEIKDNSSSSDVLDRADAVIEELEGLQTEIELEDSPEAVKAAQEKAEAEAKAKAEEEARIAEEKAENDRLVEEASMLKSGY